MRVHDAGRELLHRLAPHVYVEDLGRVSVRIGQTVLVGTEIRRKVLVAPLFPADQASVHRNT